MTNFEKISIYVPGSVKKNLEEDARLFEVCKSNNSKEININQFLGNLILGYYDQFYLESQQNMRRIASVLQGHIKTTISEKNGSKQTKTTFIDNIDPLSMQILHVLNQPVDTRTGKRSERMSLKPTKTTWPSIQDIQLSSKEDSISNTFVRLFQSYLNKPSYIREQIIWKDSYDRICEAITQNRTISFTHTKTKDEVHTVYPYRITTSAEEMFNYLLCAEPDESGTLKAKSYRLCRITNCRISNNKTIKLSETVKSYLNRMEKYGPAYEINDDEECCVFLTEEAHRSYDLVYTQRPQYSEITPVKGGYLYHFTCSKEHVERYFRRFNAGQALIQKPEWLRQKVMEYHKSILEKYEKV